MTTTETTFEEVPPTAADWQRRLDDLTGRNLPFLVAEADGTVSAGYAYASPWRPKPAYRHTVEDTVTSPPPAPAAGSAAPCSRRCSPRASRPAPAGRRGDRRHRQRRLGQSCTDPARLRAGGGLRRVGRKHGRCIDTVLMQRDLEPDR